MSSTKPIDLSEVTLVSVTGVDIDATQQAMQRCMRGIRFGRAVLMASAPPTTPDPDIEHVSIGPMDYRRYSVFMLTELHRHVTTSHALVVQADGFVLNPERWNPAWLDFDYIGAPFPAVIWAGKTRITMKNRVGNGGFSLRSQRLMQLVAPIKLETLRYPTINEDMIICHLLYDWLVGQGIRFADMETAADFSLDYHVHEGRTLATTFGFHGRQHLTELAALQNE